MWGSVFKQGKARQYGGHDPSSGQPQSCRLLPCIVGASATLSWAARAFITLRSGREPLGRRSACSPPPLFASSIGSGARRKHQGSSRPGSRDEPAALHSAVRSGPNDDPIAKTIYGVTPQHRPRARLQGAQVLVELNVGRGENGEDEEFPLRDQLAIRDPLVLPERGPVASAQAQERGMLRVARPHHHGGHGGAIHDGQAGVLATPWMLGPPPAQCST